MVLFEVEVMVPCGRPELATACAATVLPTIVTSFGGTATPSVWNAPGFAVNWSPVTGEKATGLSPSVDLPQPARRPAAATTANDAAPIFFVFIWFPSLENGDGARKAAAGL